MYNKNKILLFFISHEWRCMALQCSTMMIVAKWKQTRNPSYHTPENWHWYECVKTLRFEKIMDLSPSLSLPSLPSLLLSPLFSLSLPLPLPLPLSIPTPLPHPLSLSLPLPFPFSPTIYFFDTCCFFLCFATMQDNEEEKKPLHFVDLHSWNFLTIFSLQLTLHKTPTFSSFI
jgi:hypothetical protein